MAHPENYTILVRKVVVEGEEYFKATVAELPDLNEYADNPGEAYSLAVDAVALVLEDARRTGKKAPEPMEEVDYSGRVTLRLPRHVHRNAARLAEIDGVSLNSWLTTAVVEATTGKLVAMTLQPSTRLEMNSVDNQNKYENAHYANSLVM